MQKTLYILIILFAVAFTGCNNEKGTQNEVNSVQVPDQSATIREKDNNEKQGSTDVHSFVQGLDKLGSGLALDDFSVLDGLVKGKNSLTEGDKELLQLGAFIGADEEQLFSFFAIGRLFEGENAMTILVALMAGEEAKAYLVSYDQKAQYSGNALVFYDNSEGSIFQYAVINSYTDIKISGGNLHEETEYSYSLSFSDDGTIMKENVNNPNVDVYERTYTDEHMAANPTQTIQRMSLEINKKKGAVLISAQRKGEDYIYTYSGAWEEGQDVTAPHDTETGNAALIKNTEGNRDVVYIRLADQLTLVDVESYQEEDQGPGYYARSFMINKGSGDDNFKLYRED